MACDNTTSSIMVRVDLDDQLLDYEYSKITCGKEINANSKLLEHFQNRPIIDITNSTLEQVVQELKPLTSDDQFLLFLEWDALRNAVFQYMGKELQGYSDRYKLASISYEENHVEIQQNILPLSDVTHIETRDE
jgi:hypothetical protein